jgi:hypothetical protein
VDLQELIDELYGLDADRFVRARDEAARDLRQAGRRAEAQTLRELRKPTAAAAAVNRLVRERRREIEEFLAAAAALREAQFAGKGDLGTARVHERRALERLVELGGERVRQTLQAAAVDSQAAKDLLGGRLERELEPRGFGTLTSDVVPGGRSPRRGTTTAKPKQADDGPARARLRDAKKTLADAEEVERRARHELEQAERARARARAEVERAQAALDRVNRP